MVGEALEVVGDGRGDVVQLGGLLGRDDHVAQDLLEDEEPVG